VAPTRSRARGREHARPSAGGTATEHATKIYVIAIVGIVVITAFLALTSVGHVIDAATQHFMLFYAGVFALIGLCASVGLGLVATDRMFLNPGHRVFIQSAHRAASFGAVTFLIIHITTEILAQRVHLLDAVIPFLSPFRTFYIGLGTISSDLIILLVITGILRGRFNANGKAWRWRAIHYTSYASFVFGVWHGLLAGRPGKPYVDWSYGLLIAVVLLGLAVRVFSDSLKPKENLSTPPVKETAGSASAPLRAAVMFAQLAASRGNSYGTTAVTGGQPVLSAPVLTALPAGTPAGQGQPYYEPGYEGPQRYLGAPRATGSGPMPRANTGPLPRVNAGQLPRANTGPLPPYASGPMPRIPTGPLPRANTGPLPRANTGPLPPYASGPMPRVPTGPLPRANTGPLPPYVSGPMPRVPTGPMPGMGPVPPSAISGPLPMPPYASGPVPRVPTGPLPLADTVPLPPYAGPFPRYASGPVPGVPTGPGTGPGPQFRPATGPMPRVTGPLPQAGYARPPAWETGPQYRPPSGLTQRPADGPWQRGGTGPMPAQNGPRPRPATGPLPQAGGSMPPARFDDSGGWPVGPGWRAAGHDGGRYPAEPPWDGLQETDPNFRYREPGPGMPGYRGSREHRYGGDAR
jgi:DMSO/TMAO reductase YedYZ heme-binding membrane subunit